MTKKKDNTEQTIDPWVTNCKHSSGKENDWNAVDAYYAYCLHKPLPSSNESNEASSVLQKTPLADASKNKQTAGVDLRENWWTIRNQRESHSCVGWAIADSLLRWHFVTHSYIGPSTGLSARYIWMAAKEIDELTKRPTTFIESEGSTIKAALDVARNYGVVTEELIPSDGSQLYKGSATEFYAIAARLKIHSYYNLLRKGDTKHQFSIWRQWLHEDNGPIAIRVNVDSSWHDAQMRSSKLERYDNNNLYGGHAAAIVGYTYDDYFIIRNTWGDKWGDKGYVYISEQYAKRAIDEAYGVTVLDTQSPQVVNLGHRDPPPPYLFGEN